jgi:hypothetical protein
MKRHIDDALLDDYLEGSLSGEEERRVREHLLECTVCRRGYESRVRVAGEMAELPVEGEPPRDLWPQIAWRIEAGEQATHGRGARRFSASRRFNLPAWQLLAASIAVAVLSGGSVWYLLSAGDRTPTSLVETAVPTLATPAGLEEALDEYAVSVSGLERILDEGREVLDPETIRVLEENLAIIDRAIAEAQDALGKDPGSNVLRRLLTENLRRKVALLRQAAVAVHART